MAFSILPFRINFCLSYIIGSSFLAKLLDIRKNVNTNTIKLGKIAVVILKILFMIKKVKAEHKKEIKVMSINTS